MKSDQTVCAIQMNSTTRLDENVEKACIFIRQAATKADIICLPENALMLTESRKQLLKAADQIASVYLPRLQELSRELNRWVLCGSIPIRVDENRCTNSSIMIDPAGAISARYDKIHLFDVDIQNDQTYRESDNIVAGTTPVNVRVGNWNWGLSICYDLRFPELYRHLSQNGANVLTVPSAFTCETGKAHWQSLLAARAIENQCYLIAPAQCGSPYPGRKTWGHSMILDPWGTVLACAEEEEGPIYALLRQDEITRIRTSFPSLKHRRLS
jgi:predicted amidohydrolase